MRADGTPPPCGGQAKKEADPFAVLYFGPSLAEKWPAGIPAFHSGILVRKPFAPTVQKVMQIIPNMLIRTEAHDTAIVASHLAWGTLQLYGTAAVAPFCKEPFGPGNNAETHDQ